MWPTEALALAGAVSAAGGVATLRSAWLQRRARAHTALMVSGWAVLALSVAAWVGGFGGENGTAYFLVALSAAAFVAVGLTLEQRRARKDRPELDGDVALEPSQRGSRIWRGALRILLAGPLSGGAAIGLGLAFAVKAPIAEADRLVLGGVIVFLGWAGGMAWTLADNRILRAAAVLIAAGAAGFATAMI